MTEDLSKLLDAWRYQPGQLNVRFVQGEQGQTHIQVRLDLGILQMRYEGRPDGQHPHGYPSLLEYFEAVFDGLEPDPDGEMIDDREVRTSKPLSLTESQCRELREEASQYYHRYMALLALQDYEGVVRDTTRNLRVVDLCAKHASTEADRTELEPYRPYIMMIRARAMASLALKDNEPKAALLAIDEGIDALRRHFAEVGEPDRFDSSNEVAMLRGMRNSLVPKLPVSQSTELRQRLQQALASENYELAAILRDELRLLPDQSA